MKLLVRWGTTLSLVGTTFLGTVLGGNISALALPEAQIVKTLDSVPVFVVTNQQGLPLSRPLPETQGQKGGSVTGVFMSRQEAQAFITQLQSVKDKDPKMQELIKTLQVTPVPLGVIYNQVRQNANQANHLIFAFKPVQQEVDQAVAILRQSGQKVEQFNGVPTFIVRFGPDKGYVPIQLSQDQKQYVPVFLSKQDAVGLLNQVKGKYPTADIQVADIDGIIGTMKEKNDAWLSQVVIVPSAEAREYIKTLPRNSNQNRPAKKP